MSDIQEEQKRLYKKAEENDIRHFILETKDYGNFDVVEYEKYKELQDRINKAIEYIKIHIQPDSFEGYLDSYEIKKTLNILQGVDKE